ncbi:hypothetical protein [Ralstonia pseudosolanacearum]|uniref:Uncharacterized protein n=1 Tax=Ralstonia solanacearum TaxID=305 RepID=A0AA92JQ46_RALSL|nr:hypothetical protein [Ralstonia pseudosolanacearum]QOK90731.1 hypothetical protein HF908_04035 [Ralstonia pseudosolanacearum]QOK95660.1 hypothetical protein HF909_03915 [Ralstonia pseudosolanacearum]UWD91687.1 hypothetical protein NY025_11845 [Ralstonia pseudosolanacearum]CAH0444999.1 hypothetical protein LMG9673_04513 [Ralstonia pseudosolanacearum]
MFYSFDISFRTRQGKHYKNVVIDLLFQRRTAIAMAFLDARRTVALVPKQPLRSYLRSAQYESDPMPVAEAVIKACLSDLEDGLFVEKRAVRGLRWTRATFDRPKIARWAGWTSKIRCVARSCAAQMTSNAVAP